MKPVVAHHIDDGTPVNRIKVGIPALPSARRKSHQGNAGWARIRRTGQSQQPDQQNELFHFQPLQFGYHGRLPTLSPTTPRTSWARFESARPVMNQEGKNCNAVPFWAGALFGAFPPTRGKHQKSQWPPIFGGVLFSFFPARCSVPKPLSRAGKIGLPPSC